MSRRTMVMLMLAAFVLSACTPALEIASGAYLVAAPNVDPENRTVRTQDRATDVIERMVVDLPSGVVSWHLSDGSVVEAKASPRSDWSTGCPSNLGSSSMQVADVETRPLTLAGITFDAPILVRSCPESPPRVVLREDGEVGGAGAGCQDQEACIFFVPDVDLPWSLQDVQVATEVNLPITIPLLDSDQERNARVDFSSLRVGAGPDHGTVTTFQPLADGARRYDGTVTYEPEDGFVGVDSFRVRVGDTAGHWQEAVVTVTVERR